MSWVAGVARWSDKHARIAFRCKTDLQELVVRIQCESLVDDSLREDGKFPQFDTHLEQLAILPSERTRVLRLILSSLVTRVSWC